MREERSAAALKDLMVREISRLTPNVEAAVTNLRRLTVIIGGARDLRVGADGRIRPDGGVVAARIRPYVSVFVIGKSGRRLEAPGAGRRDWNAKAPPVGD